MRHAQGGGLTAERQAFREQVRLEAAARFEAGEKTSAIARDLRVSERSVERWRRSWREGGPEALCSSGPASVPKLSAARFAELEEELGKGPGAHGFEDQCWTRGRVQAVIGRRFRIRLSIATVWRLLKRNGWSWQAPARRTLTGRPGQTGPQTFGDDRRLRHPAGPRPGRSELP
ncbi:winged helix-turn-helix domain-containing protein [Kitasatospora sp. NPDC004669]|uniref:winged helix-turn-helix domain-containing protein n=1 Tax=Kitasatospora sp. NPDC004669 TaxID=3154555 RepID=UPI0033BC952E